MTESPSARERLSFLVIGIAMLVFVDQVILGGSRPYIDDIREEVQKEKASGLENDEVQAPAFSENGPEETEEEADKEETKDQKEDILDIGFSEIEDLKSSIHSIDYKFPPVGPFIRIAPEKPIPRNSLNQQKKFITPVWKKNAVKTNASEKFAKVAIILDDMGVNRKMSEAAIDLKGPLTLSFLPYARDGKGMVRRARRLGHEIMVHVPMEPLNGGLNPGPDVLLTSMDRRQLSEILDKNLKVYKGYVGVNNHMGSKLTQDPRAMAEVMSEIRDRGLLFVDSRTINTSVADETAEAFGVAHASRDVFLDHHPDYKSVMKSLRKLEEIALRRGSAIAIGHPKKDTIRAIYEWMPTLYEKGIALVPVSALVKMPEHSGFTQVNSASGSNVKVEENIPDNH